ncbi:MAG TPA: hypothetical protein VK207_09420 [Bacteroidales bacterium]|nr:hypothetical protein [Bacteroidales bacterium]
MSIFRLKIFTPLLMLPLAFLPAFSSAQTASEMKEIFAQAESYYLYGEYELANQLYILLDSTNNRNIQYKIGICYLNIPGEKEKSVPYLEKAVLNASYDAKETRFKEKRAPLDAYFYLAKAYMTNNQLEKGLNTFNTFSRLAGETNKKGGMQNLDFVGQQMQACNNALSLRENPVAFSKKSLGADFSQGSLNENPAVSYDGNTIVYTERRGIVNVIYYSKKIRGIWQPPVEITADLNAGEDCSSCSLNNDGTELYLYKVDDYDGVIYSSSFVNDKWTPIKKLNKNINTKFYESHAAVSADGKKLYFTSNREGGLGELDIYLSEKDATGDWGPAKNLGPVINTPFNEDTPFITANDSLLFFSSEGHSSMGGFDIYKSLRMDSAWSVPSNVGYPVNSTDDDKFFQPANNGLNAYYSLNTDYKEKDIFYLNFGDLPFELKGVMSLSDTTLIYDDNYMICVTDKVTGDTIARRMPDPYSGNYDIRLKPGKYEITYKGKGYFDQTIDTAIAADFPLAEVYVDVSLRRDPSAARPAPKIVYEKINLSEIPTIDAVDTALLIRDMNVNDISETVEEEILYYTVQVIALYNPVDVSYFKYIDDIKIMYNAADRFYRYTTGEFPTREDAHKWRLDLISKGYPEEIFIKKVSRDTNQ